jgi:2'-hydroxyisoflavone reductase
MRLLVLGGTLFLGRHLVDEALVRGHDVTLFTRGRTNAELFPEAERLHGDRDGGLQALAGREWDAVVDTSGYVPRVVRESARLLAPAVGMYAFVSSVSAYADVSRTVDEDALLAVLDDPASEDVDRHYGALKAASEREVQDAFGERALIVRPGLVVGPHDPTDRFTYWVERGARGGEMLAPGSPDRQIQLIDARDVARFVLDMLARGAGGVFNLAGPVPPATMADLVEAVVREGHAGTRPVWVPDALLLAHGAGEWVELPLWVASPEWRALLAVDVSRAVAAGLRLRPLDETVRDTLAWARRRDGERPAKPGPRVARAGLGPARERDLLAAWRAS